MIQHGGGIGNNGAFHADVGGAITPSYPFEKKFFHAAEDEQFYG